MKQQQQHWENMVNMCINNKCLFTLHSVSRIEGKGLEEKRENIVVVDFFPPLFQFHTSRSRVDVEVLHNHRFSLFFSSPHFFFFTGEQKKKREKKERWWIERDTLN